MLTIPAVSARDRKRNDYTVAPFDFDTSAPFLNNPHLCHGLKQTAVILGPYHESVQIEPSDAVEKSLPNHIVGIFNNRIATFAPLPV
jgi:hypothetical protein